MPKHFDSALKAEIVLTWLKGQKSVTEICQEYGAQADQVTQWCRTFLEQAPTVFQKNTQSADLQKNHGKEVARLQGRIDRLTQQLSWLEHKSGIKPD